jgi:aryl-alcohol dehydrogenase-like predicted oxidoreductase
VDQPPACLSTDKETAMIQRAPFGATGHDSSRVIFGAAALGDVPKAGADGALDVVLEHGVNHIDVVAGYGDAELRIAPWLRRHPGTFFLAAKTGERSYRGAREQIRRSLDRLGVDQPRRRHRVGHRPERRRCPGGGDRGA